MTEIEKKHNQIINNTKEYKRCLNEQLNKDYSDIMGSSFNKGHQSATEMALKLFDIWFMEFSELIEGSKP